MVVRLHLVLEIADCLLQLLSLLFECFHALFDFGMFVAQSFDGHAASFDAGILAFEHPGFKAVVWLPISVQERQTAVISAAVVEPET
jgi:hypothetical protein